MRTVILKMFMLLALSLIIGCGNDKENYLNGSVTELFDMNFDSVRARLYPESALSIEYVVNNGESGEKIPLRVTIDKKSGEIKVNIKYDFLHDATIARGVGYESSALPELESGHVELVEYSKDNPVRVKGSFVAIFIGSKGNKLNLRGGFLSDIEVVE
jgi:hypothetical protein